MHRFSQRLHELLEELGDLHDKKQRDYGIESNPFNNICASTEWGIRPWVGAMMRATDKVRRLQVFAAKGRLVNEGAIDSLKDIAVYALIALVLLEQETLEKDLVGT